MNYLKYLILWVGLILPNLTLAADAEEGQDFPKYMGFVRSPYNAVQLLGAQVLTVDEAWVESQLPRQASVTHNLHGFGILEQESLGACTANAASGALWGTHMQNGVEPLHLARLPLYYWSREKMAERGDVTATQRDTGASLYDVTVVLREIGYLPEERAPYNVAAFTTKPTVKVKAEAAKHKVSDEMGVAWVGPDVRAAQVALANGLPVVFGMTIHQSFLHLGSDGVVEMPTWRDRQAGGHAMILTGYDADREVFMLQNSWGPRWGKKGTAEISFAHWAAYASEAWAYHRVTGAPEAGELLQGMTLESAPEDFAI